MSVRTLLPAIVLLLPLAGRLAFAQPAGTFEKAVVEITRARAGAVVAIARIRRETGIAVADPFDPFPIRPSDLPQQDFVPNDFGTGVLLRATPQSPAYVLTNHHVVRGGPTEDEEGEYRLVARLATRHQVPVRIFAADPRSDLAILELDPATRVPRNLPAVVLDEPVDLEKGRFVVAFGNPYAIARDGSPSVSLGMISNRGRRPTPAGPPLDEETRRRETIHHFGTLLHVDGRLNLGSSGGPMFDLEGRFAGLTTSLAALEGYEKSAGYAVPMDATTHRIVRDLLRGFEVEYGFLGVEPLDFRQEESASLPGNVTQPTAARVGRVFPNSPANRGLTNAGGLYPNDVVLSVRGLEPRTRPATLYDKQDLIREVGRFAPGTEVEFDVYRPHERRRLTVRIRLGKWPVENETDIVAPSTRHPDWRGLRVDFPTARRRHFGKPYVFHDAVLLVAVAPETKATPRQGEGELREGAFVTHVNGQPVSTPAEFARITGNVDGTAVLRLLGGDEFEIGPLEPR